MTGASISEVCGIYLGGLMQNVMRVFSVVLLVMVGTVFAVGPAGLIVTLFSNGGAQGLVVNKEMWLWIILAYYFIATFISIDQVSFGKIYSELWYLPRSSWHSVFAFASFCIFTKPEYVDPASSGAAISETSIRAEHRYGCFMIIHVACGADLSPLPHQRFPRQHMSSPYGALQEI